MHGITSLGDLKKRMAALPTSIGYVRLDMRYSEMGASCLPHLLDWLEAHASASACVGFSSISHTELFKEVIRKTGSLAWVYAGRINIGSTEDSLVRETFGAETYMRGREDNSEQLAAVTKDHAETRRILSETVAAQQAAALRTQAEADRVAKESEVAHVASKLQHAKIAQQLDELTLIVKESAAESQAAAARITKESEAAQLRRDADHDKLIIELRELQSSSLSLAESTRQIRNWQTQMTHAYDVLVTHLVRVHLKLTHQTPGFKVWELPHQHRRVAAVPLLDFTGFEWDGVLWLAGLCHLYLIEAKSALHYNHITGMDARLLHTVKYISMCSSGRMEGALRTTPANFGRLSACKAWALYAGATKVYGVIGGIGFTQQMLSKAATQGLMSVVPANGIYKVQVPDVGLTNFLRVSREAASSAAASSAGPEESTEQAASSAASRSAGPEETTEPVATAVVISYYTEETLRTDAIQSEEEEALHASVDELRSL